MNRLILLALFLLCSPAFAQDNCKNVTEFVQYLEQHNRTHTLIRSREAGVFIREIEEAGVQLSQRPDYVIVVEFPERDAVILAFGAIDKICDFFIMPKQRARELLSSASVEQ